MSARCFWHHRAASRRRATTDHSRRCTMNAQRTCLTLWLCSVALSACREPTQPTRLGAPTLTREMVAANDDNGPVTTIDHLVPHISTVLANAGEPVTLFLRERVRSDIEDGRYRQAVLMIHGRSTPVL